VPPSPGRAPPGARTHLLEPVALTLEQAAEATGVGRRTIINAVSRGELQAHKLGSLTRIAPDELRRWIKSLPRAPFRAPEPAA
jgi:excisionase family DNA binding protein